MTARRSFLANQAGSSAAEFALVLPLLMIIFFTLISGGYYLYTVNRLEKAAQWGSRFAVVTQPVTDGLAKADYVGATVGGTTLGQGDTIPRGALGEVNCTKDGCCVAPTTCTTPYPALGTFSSTAFGNIVARMQLIDPEIQDSNVTVTYRGSGLGYAGDPSGMQIAPLVSVTISGMTWQPITGYVFNSAVIPTISSTLSIEDAVGNTSY